MPLPLQVIVQSDEKRLNFIETPPKTTELQKNDRFSVVFQFSLSFPSMSRLSIAPSISAIVGIVPSTSSG